MRYYFKLQYLRFKRDLKNSGINFIIGIVFLLSSFIFLSDLVFKKLGDGSQLYAFIALLVISTLGEKFRNLFLRSIFPQVIFLKIRLLENLLAAFPFLIFLVIEKYYFTAFVTLSLSSILSLYNKFRLRGFQIPSPFSKNPYEFTVGFRTTYLLIIFVYSIAFISIYCQYFYLGLLSLLSIFFLCLTFYSESDPIYYVWVHSQTSKVFLQNKLKVALLYSFSLSLIILLPLCLFYYLKIGIVILVLITGLLYVVHGILAVFVNFPMKKTLSQNVQFYIGILIPPLLFFIIPNMYYQAIHRLKEYLNVNH